MEPNPYEAPREQGYSLPAPVARTKFSVLRVLAISAMLITVAFGGAVIAGIVIHFLRSG